MSSLYRDILNTSLIKSIKQILEMIIYKDYDFNLCIDFKVQNILKK